MGFFRAQGRDIGRNIYGFLQSTREGYRTKPLWVSSEHEGYRTKPLWVSSEHKGGI